MTLIFEGDVTAPIDTRLQAWLEGHPGQRLLATQTQVRTGFNDDQISETCAESFAPESLVVTEVLEGAAVVAGDYQPSPDGALAFNVFVKESTGAGRVGRILQRVHEISVYQILALIGLPVARQTMADLDQTGQDLVRLNAAISSDTGTNAENLDALLAAADRLEGLAGQHAYRFSATKAYAAIVEQRVEVLQEVRFHGRQTLREFVVRRFLPAVRTVEAADNRLNRMAARVARSSELLRTKLDVDMQLQNRKLLASMDRRADLQLRLQQTVEGLSVVAISYYAVNLAGYLMGPLAERMGWSKPWVMAAVTVPILLAVWGLVRRIRRKFH